jgi:hypothetical protein
MFADYTVSKGDAMTTENLTVKVSVPLDGAIARYLVQFPGKSRASVVTMIVADYLANGGCFGTRAAAMPAVVALAPVKSSPPKPVIREPEVPHSLPPPEPVMAAERPSSSPSSARDKIKDMLS